MRGAPLLVLLLLGAPTVRAGGLLEDAARIDTDADESAHQLLVHGLAEDETALAADVRVLDALDRRREDAGLPRSGLADDARYLAAALVMTRDGRRAALEKLQGAHPDPVIRRLVEYRLGEDDATAANHLLADDRHNRRAALLNDAVRPLGLFSGTAFLAALNPFLLGGSVLDSVVTTAGNLWHYDRLSPREREALVRYRTLAEREARTEEAPEILQALRRLGTKRARALCDDTVELGKKSLARDDLEHAWFYLQDAHRLDECADRATKPLAETTEALARRAAREEAGAWPAENPPEPASDLEGRDHDELARAAASGDPAVMIEAAQRFLERHPDSDLAPAAHYTVAVARDLGGHPDASRTALAELARDGGSSAGRHAAALLANADYNRLGALDNAERRHGRDVVRYVLLGGTPDGRSAVYAAAHLGAEGMRAAQSFGIFNVIGLVTRAWQAWRHDPASNQEIIDRGEEFLARTPHAPESFDVHGRLAIAYERAGNYGRALMHYRETPDPDAKRIARLEGKIADGLLADAERDSTDRLRLETIVDHFADTKAAKKARERLRDRPGAGETKISREVLEANPSLAGPNGLDLDPALLDGDRENGELADAGVTLTDGELRLQLKNEHDKGERIETRPLAPEVAARARAAAEEALYERSLAAARDTGDSGRYERYIPFFVQGSLGDDGSVSVYPGLKMHRYESDNRQLYE